MARYLVTYALSATQPTRTKYIDDAVGPPDANVDAGTDGVAFGSILWDGTDLWFCTDPTTAAATWEQIGGGGAGAAEDVTFTPGGSISSTDVQSAIVEVAAEAGGSFPAGTSFPGSPSAGDLYFRTDIRGGMLFSHDGTRWLSSLLVANGSIDNQSAAGGVMRMPTPSDYALWLERIEWTTLVVTTNTGSAYWNFLLDKVIAANTGTTVASMNTSADSANVWVRHGADIDAALATTDLTLRVTFTKTASPGNMYVAASIYYHLIGT